VAGAQQTAGEATDDQRAEADVVEVDGGEGDDWLVELGQGEAAAGEEEPEATNDQIEEAEGDDSFFDSEGDAADLCLEQPL